MEGEVIGPINLPGRKGNRGRPPGSKGVFGANFKAMLLEVLELRGGVAALHAWSDEDPAMFYGICAKLIPRQVEISGNINVNLADAVEKARKRANAK